jgi:small multidrug resistance pump
MNHWLALSIAVLAEVVATTSLKATAEFTRFWPSVLVVSGYLVAFYFMTISLRTLSVGIMYAIWAGAGIVLVSIAGWFVYRQNLDAPAIIGIGLIVSGVIIINLFSKSIVH